MGKGKRLGTLLLIIVDIIIINLSYVTSFYIRLGTNIPPIYRTYYINYLPFILITYIAMFIIFKLYRSIWENAGIDEVISGATASIVAATIIYTVMEFMPYRVPRIVTILSAFFITILILAVRLSFRFIERVILYGTRFNSNYNERVLIIGAGDCAQMLIEESRRDKTNKYKIVGLIDDDKNKRNTYLKGIKVLGNRNDIISMVKNKKIDAIMLAIPSISSKDKTDILEICKEAKVKMKIVPSFYELIDDNIGFKKMRDVDLRDLLGRDEIELDKQGISQYIKDKVVLVTGGGGSIGSELCRQIVKYSPKKLLILDIYENSVYDLQNELTRKIPEIDKDVFIASIRDRERLEEIFEDYKPQVVFHAAAHKHVPLMEFNPSEAIKNNVVGTLNLAECADKYNVERFVLISTDKAVNPTNVMGATKRLCEMVVQAVDKKSKTEFVAVRFGNVLGSNGSVIPLFQKQISEGGPVTLTHKEITRYFMLIPEAAQLVLQAGAYAKGGEIFVLDMGKPVKIINLAENLIKLLGYEPYKDIKIEITGLRPGEKLYEELLMDEEGLQSTPHEKIFVGKLTHVDLDELKKEINELLAVAKTGNKNNLKIKLHEVVPTYTITEHEIMTTVDK